MYNQISLAFLFASKFHFPFAPSKFISNQKIKPISFSFKIMFSFAMQTFNFASLLELRFLQILIIAKTNNVWLKKINTSNFHTKQFRFKSILNCYFFFSNTQQILKDSSKGIKFQRKNLYQMPCWSKMKIYLPECFGKIAGGKSFHILHTLRSRNKLA